MAADKTLFAPVPLRAMADDLSGLEMRVLTCVASHDRMSLVVGKGQGCRASNERMSKMVGCSFARVCTTLTALTERGYLDRSKPGRNTVYRVIYTDADRLLFGNVSPASTGCRIGTVIDRIGSRLGIPSDGNQTGNRSQYIPLNGVINSEESGEDNSPEGALGKIEFGDNVGAQLASLERALKAGDRLDCLAWDQRLTGILENEEDNATRGWAMRLAELVVEAMSPNEYRKWGEDHGWVDDDGKWHAPHPREAA